MSTEETFSKAAMMLFSPEEIAGIVASPMYEKYGKLEVDRLTAKKCFDALMNGGEDGTELVESLPISQSFRENLYRFVESARNNSGRHAQ